MLHTISKMMYFYDALRQYDFINISASLDGVYRDNLSNSDEEKGGSSFVIFNVRDVDPRHVEYKKRMLEEIEGLQ